MDFAWSPAQIELHEGVLRFAKSLNGTLAAREAAGGVFGREEWRRLGAHGLLRLFLAEGDGGLGLDFLSTARAMEAFGQGCEDTGLVFSAAAHMFACTSAIAEHAAPSLRARVLPALADGSLIAGNAITEAGAGSDVFALRSRAERVGGGGGGGGGGWLISGEKSFVTNGPVADVFLVYAVTNARHGYFGISAFVVDRGAAGVTVGAPFDKIGLATAPTSSVYFADVRVPDDAMLGAEGQGAVIFERSMAWERACLFAAYLGVMERSLGRCVAYAKERKQFGKPIGDNQAVAHRIADMKLRLDAARLLVYRACWLADRGGDGGDDVNLAISLAKLAVSEAAVQSGLDAIRIHGGAGVVRELGIERALRDAVPCTIFSGTSEMQRTIVARALGL